ncbi:MAG: hypothetical protein GIKADHBN_00228 [Phycisphaerales bacterium]|nr:hypothetical protein [Phycisphaerales bacterium]
MVNGVRSTVRASLAVVCAGAALAWGPRIDQSSPPAAQPEPVSREAQQRAAEHILKSALLLGQRTASIRSQIPVLSTVVIVPDDANSYIRAIAGWTPGLRYPVLIDDGSIRATEDIARFVRAFKPATVVRWTAPSDPQPGQPEPVKAGVPEHHPKLLSALSDWAVGKAWGTDKPASDVLAYVAHLKAMNLVPPGIVITNPEDTAWTAGVALAAGHGQPIAWIKAPQAPGGTMNVAQATALVEAVDAACKATGLKYDALGDELDAIALCLNVGPKFPKGEGPQMMMAATTDVVGRRAFNIAGDNATRWGWASIVWGTRPRAAYAAMCSLFLQPSRGWIFDGYGDEGSFTAYDGTQAGERLALAPLKPKFEVDVNDAPDQGEAKWRAWTSRPLDASLIMVNTMGNADFFDVKPGRLKPADIPMLGVPAAVYFVHSWSASDVNIGTTVAGRWFNRGAFAYLGSVQEPFLQAFVPTPMVATRLAAGFPWSAAVRVEGSPIWKIACFGDPLWTLTMPGPRKETAEAPLPLKDAVALDDQLKQDLRAGKFAQAARTLVLLGRDNDVARLTDSTLKDKAGAVTSEFVTAALPALFRAGRGDLVPECYTRLDNQPSADEYLRDILWFSAQAQLAGSPSKLLVDVLSQNIRLDNRDRDEVVVKAAQTRLK